MDNQEKYLSKRYYSEEFKHQVCKDHMESGLKLCELVKKYNLTTHTLIHDWLRQFGYINAVYRKSSRVTYIGLENYQALSNQSIKQTGIKSDSSNLNQSEIERLKRELEDAKLQAQGYKRMIEIAEEELKIPIRKKYNTK
jgi:transposase-like protein